MANWSDLTFVLFSKLGVKSVMVYWANFMLVISD